MIEKLTKIDDLNLSQSLARIESKINELVEQGNEFEEAINDIEKFLNLEVRKDYAKSKRLSYDNH